MKRDEKYKDSMYLKMFPINGTGMIAIAEILVLFIFKTFGTLIKIFV